MILFPNKEYSQGFLDELNFICHGFLDPVIDYFLDVGIDDSLVDDLEPYFPSYLLYEDVDRCYSILKELHEWTEDNYYHPVTRLQEYVLMRVIRDQWILFNDLPEEDSKDLRNVFYSLSGKNHLSQEETQTIAAMKDNELLSLGVLFDDINFGELELIASFRQEIPFTFLRF